MNARPLCVFYFLFINSFPLMKKELLLSVLVLLSIATASYAQPPGQINPVIKSSGGVFPVPEAISLVDAQTTYKIIGDLTTNSEKPDEMSPGLERAARLFNAYSEAGVPPSRIDMVIAIHFKATPIILSDAAYKEKFGVPNPNTATLNELAEKGVRFYICGQSLRMRGFTQTPRNPHIQVAHAALIVTTVFQQKGYSLLPM